MKKLIVANFKMNQTPEETKEYLIKFVSRFYSENVQVVLCPPFTSLGIAQFLTEGSKVKIGAQNVSDQDDGLLTGEISAKMLKETGVDYVIIGHSDRRNKFKEGNALINKKIKNALKHGLKCILCVGETLAEKNTNKTAEVIRRQVEEGLKGLYENELEGVVVSYEPVWSIGTGKVATGKDIEAASKVIRKSVETLYSEKAGRDICVIYGGSLSSANIQKIMQCKGIDGGLLGGGSLDVDAFLEICNKLR